MYHCCVIRKVNCRGVYLGLGSNLANRKRNLMMAVTLLKRCRGISFVRLSSIYETEAWGREQRPFLNAVVAIGTSLSPQVLLELVKKIENRLRRRRRFKWSERTLDIDILLYRKRSLRRSNLTIPHKYITERLFVLEPLAELDASIRLNGESIEEIIGRLKESR